jgi:LmbE family N-acetylglucosaminyl deacetylase
MFFGAHPDDESFGPGSTLARYALAGVKVYVVCSTGGEIGTVSPEYMKGYTSVIELRTAELDCAARELGLAGLIRLGYRDSGMQGTEDNRHPDCLAVAPIEEVSGKMVKIMREIQPDVVITHDPSADYGHPDHIATHKATVKAFHAAGDLTQYPEAGPIFQPRKLYFLVRPRGLMKLMIRLMPLFGQDPHHFGRNGDIDMTKMTSVEYPIRAIIRLPKKAVEVRNRAAACHASQGGGGGFRSGPFWLLGVIGKLRGPRDYFMREFPPATRKRREKDLFEGLAW